MSSMIFFRNCSFEKIILIVFALILDPCYDGRCNGGVCTPDASAWGGFTCNCSNIQFDGYTSTMYGYTCNLGIKYHMCS